MWNWTDQLLEALGDTTEGYNPEGLQKEPFWNMLRRSLLSGRTSVRRSSSQDPNWPGYYHSLPEHKMVRQHHWLICINASTHASDEAPGASGRLRSLVCCIQVAKNHIKRCPMWRIVSGTQIKTTMTYHLTPVRTAIIKKTIKKC